MGIFLFLKHSPLGARKSLGTRFPQRLTVSSVSREPPARTPSPLKKFHLHNWVPCKLLCTEAGILEAGVPPEPLRPLSSSFCPQGL